MNCAEESIGRGTQWREVQAHLDSDVLLAVFDYWASLETRADLPRWSAFDHTRINDVLPHVVLMGVRTTPLDFSFLIIGTDILAHFATDYTGQWFSEISHRSDPSALYTNLSRAVIERRPIVSETPYVGPKKDYKLNKEVILPMTDDEGLINRLVVIIDFIWSQDDS
ncbi:MAG: PAS domain-containing protein [Pseudomonadota bacterium]